MRNFSKLKLSLAIVAFLAAAACGPIGGHLQAPEQRQGRTLLEEANRLRGRDNYISLKRAFTLYKDLYVRPSLRDAVLVPYLETSLLLTVRGKELGIGDPLPFETAGGLIANHRALSRYRPFFEIAFVLPVKTKGVMTDIDNKFAWVKLGEDLQPQEPRLRQRALADEFSAYLYAAWISERFDYGKIESLDEIYGRFPLSKSLRYKAAASIRSVDTDALGKLLDENSEFYEAHFQLGQAALGKGLLLEAEKEFLKSYQGIPESPETRILLASIYFATEETDKSLEFYEKTLEIAPEYRDAILGKAICLTTLGRNKEAIAVLEKNLALGYWLLGETHFWLAWNYHALKDGAKASFHIEEAKTRLGTASEVFSLSGTIRFEAGNKDGAETDFREALRHNTVNTEALLGLGHVFAKREIWIESGEWYLKAGDTSEMSAAAVRAKIGEIEGSDLLPARKEALLRKKRAQLDSHLQSRAMAFYLAAAALANGGRTADALGAAEKAAGHSLYKQKAEELAAKIRSLKEG